MRYSRINTRHNVQMSKKREIKSQLQVVIIRSFTITTVTFMRYRHNYNSHIYEI